MKKIKVTMIVSAILCGALFISCGGSGVKSNEVLGKLPTIHADNALAEKAVKEKQEKLLKSGDLVAIMKEAAKEETAKKERREKFETAKKAEWGKIDGRDVPFTVSKDFERLNFKIESVKLNAEKQGMTITAKVKEDADTNYSTVQEYRYVNYRALAKDGSEITKGGTVYSFRAVPTKFTAGQELLNADGSPLTGSLSVNSDPEKWANFASIEFITADEMK